MIFHVVFHVLLNEHNSRWHQFMPLISSFEVFLLMGFVHTFPFLWFTALSSTPPHPRADREVYSSPSLAALTFAYHDVLRLGLTS